MTKYLNECHLVKQGLRFWFTNDDVKSLDDAGEVGGHYQVRLPSYQLDRATFDEEVLRRACLAGAKLLRTVSVTKVELNPGGEEAITFRNGDAIETVCARWIVDASGVAALLARKEGWWRQNTDHPTAAAWSRRKGVKDWDSYYHHQCGGADHGSAARRADGGTDRASQSRLLSLLSLLV